jgi:hypothetical protein
VRVDLDARLDLSTSTFNDTPQRFEITREVKNSRFHSAPSSK